MKGLFLPQADVRFFLSSFLWSVVFFCLFFFVYYIFFLKLSISEDYFMEQVNYFNRLFIKNNEENQKLEQENNKLQSLLKEKIKEYERIKQNSLNEQYNKMKASANNELRISFLQILQKYSKKNLKKSIIEELSKLK